MNPFKQSMVQNIVYHSSNKEFEQFDKKMIGTSTDEGIWGRGIYFSNNASNFEYGNIQYQCYINITNPFIINDFKTVEEIAEYLDVWEGNFYIPSYEETGLIHFSQSQIRQITSHIIDKGHDGVIVKLTPVWTEYVVFSPEQIQIINTVNRIAARIEQFNMTERLEKLIDEDIFITHSPYDIKNILKNKPKEYRIIYDDWINTYIIADSSKYINEDLILKAYQQGCYAGCSEMDDFTNGIYFNKITVTDFMAERFEDETFLRLVWVPKDKPIFLGADDYDFAYKYEYGTMLSREGYWETSDLYKVMGEPLSTEASFDESMNERLEKLGDCFATTSAYEIANLLKNKPKEYRILYDKNIGYYFIGDADSITHWDMLQKAYRDAFYYNMEDFINSLGEFENYVEVGQDGGWDANDEEIEPYLWYIVFSPNEEWELGTDGYNKRYDYPFGHVFTRGCDLDEIELWDALGLPQNSEKLNENLEKLQDGINMFGEDEAVYATKSDYDIINLLKNKPEFYRFIWDSKSGYYIISNGDTCIHADLSNIGYSQGILDSRFIKDGICSLTFWKYDNEDDSRISDGCNFKYKYPFGYIYTRFDMSLEETSLYKTLGEPLEKIELSSSDMNESADNLNDAFWKWFGKSKVVDNQGKPLVVYHGTNNKFEIFKLIKHNHDAGYYGAGFYFASTPGEASYYGKIIMPCYLKIENPFTIKYISTSAEDKVITETTALIDLGFLQDKDIINSVELWKKYRYLLDYVECKKDGNEWVAVFTNIDSLNLSKPDYEWLKYERPIGCGYSKENAIDNIWLQIKEHFKIKLNFSLTDYIRNNSYEFTEFLKKNNYDGVIIGDEYVVFNSNQIKAVDNKGTWSITSDNIYESLNKELERYL